MSIEPKTSSEASLDPADWEELRSLAHQMLDDALDSLATVRDRPLWQPMPESIKDRFDEPLPREGTDLSQVYSDFRNWVQPYNMGNVHPRFWAWVIGAGTPAGVLAEMLAATLNPNTGGGEQAAAYVERQVLRWCCEMLGYPASASGLLVSGASMANFVGLSVARQVQDAVDVRTGGMCQSQRRLIVYSSVQTHSSVEKSVQLLGFGEAGYRQLPVDTDFRLDVEALQEAIENDLNAGHQPCAVVANLGTVNTGACDDLNAIGEVCDGRQLWMHVDGAFGALARLCPELDGLTAGLERADSLAFDLHKWMSVPYEAACILVRDARAHRETFELTPEYLVHVERGLASGEFWPSEYGPELSRGFKALKVWMSLRTHGIDRYAEAVRRNVAQIAFLCEQVEAASELEMMAPAPLNVACFRYRAAPEPQLDDLNREIVMRLQEAGIAAPSLTRINGRTVIRVANVNHRSRRSDFELLVEEVLRLGAEMASQN